MDLKILFPNRWQIVSPVDRDGRSQVEVFMDGLADSFQSNMEGLLIMMERHSKLGPDTFNTAQCHYVDQGEKIYEYIKGRLRIFWFEDDDKIVVCTHGIVKKQQKTPKAEIQRAIRVKKMYIASKSQKSLIFLTED